MKRLILASAGMALAIGGTATGMAVSASAAPSQPVPRGVTVYLGTFIDGQTSTEFTLIDTSRGPAVRYTCAFARPKQTSASTWTPQIVCSK